MKVFITREIPSAAIKLLNESSFLEVEIYKKDKPISPKELLKGIEDADAVISFLTDKFDRFVIDQMPKCKIIANYAVGFNNIDVDYAKSKNIIVTNTPDVLTDSTTDLAITLALTCSRKVINAEKFMREGKFNGWEPDLFLGIELKDKIFGIMGAGRIGTAVGLRAYAFGTKIIYFSNNVNRILERKTKAKKVTLNTLLKKSDFVSVHLPLTDKTYHLLSKEKLKLLKENCIFINTARGEIVDEKELIKILKAHKILAAGLDVFENESHTNPELLKLDNAVLLPHIGSATIEARTKMALLTIRNVIAVLSGKKALTPV